MCLAQEHNAVPRQRLKPGPLDPESSARSIRPPQLRNWKLRLGCCRVPVICILLFRPDAIFYWYFNSPAVAPRIIVPSCIGVSPGGKGGGGGGTGWKQMVAIKKQV